MGDLTRKKGLFLPLLAVLALSASCKESRTGQGPAHASLDAKAEPLRGAFNRRVNQTRVLALVAPT